MVRVGAGVGRQAADSSLLSATLGPGPCVAVAQVGAPGHGGKDAARSGLSSWPLRSGAAAQVRAPGHWGAHPQRHGQQPWVQNSVGLPCTRAGQARTLSSLGRPLALLTREEPRLPLSRAARRLRCTPETPLGPGPS